MQIKKSDIIKYLNTVQNEKKNTNIADGKEEPASEAKNLHANISKEKFSIDRMRNQILHIQSEANQIQTEISQRQVQIAFLEQIDTEEHWPEKLSSFMGERFQSKVTVNPDPDLNTYLNRLNHEISNLNNNLLSREVKIENILSSGVIDIENGDISRVIVKDMKEAEKVFSRMRTDSIHKFLING